MSFHLHAIAALGLAASLAAAEVAPTLPPECARGYTLAWADEFGGDALDRSEWNVRTGERFASVNLPQNVSVADGKLRIALRKEKVGKLEYTSGGVISKREFKYGCYEARFKGPAGAGWHTSFWLMKNTGGQTGNRQEIDICEHDSKDLRSYGANLHIHHPAHKGIAGRRVTTPDLSASFHTWTTEFTPREVRHYFDGKLVCVTHATNFQHDVMSVWLTVVGWANLPWNPKEKIDDTKLPGIAEYDYVRFFTKPGIEHEAPRRPRTVVVFGDSLTEGGALPKEQRDQAWVRMVERESSGALRVINEGKGGRATGDGKHDFEKMLARQPQADHLVIALGTNDSRDLKPGSVEKAVANVRHMIDRARATYGPALPVLVAGPPNIHKAALVATKPIANEREAQLKALGAAFESLAKETQCGFVGLFGVVPEDTMTRDGVHPDAAGNAAIARAILRSVMP